MWMSTRKQSRRKGPNKLEPIDWHEFANDAVLNGNMSTLYRRPDAEDPTAYASAEALVEIEKRSSRSIQPAPTVGPQPLHPDIPTVGMEPPGSAKPTVGTIPTVDTAPTVGLELPDIAESIEVTGSAPTEGDMPTVGPRHTVELKPTVGVEPPETTAFPDDSALSPTVGPMPTVGLMPTVESTPAVGLKAPIKDPTPTPTVGMNETVGPPAPSTPDSSITKAPTVGLERSVGTVPTVGPIRKRVKPIRDVQDALTLAGQVLYKAMYGVPDGARSKTCSKGYRQLATEAHLDKDTVRDLICEFKEKGIVRQVGTYDPDTRSAKTYEVFSYRTILQIWRDTGLAYVTTGRNRPAFCTAQGDPLTFIPTVGIEPIVASAPNDHKTVPTVGLNSGDSQPAPVPVGGRAAPLQLLQALQEITGGPVDQDAADRLVRDCRAMAADCTIEEIVEFAWSKAFLCRSGKIENPIGFLITQIPRHFQGDALRTYREARRRELESAAEFAAREEQRSRENERELAELEERQMVRSRIAERHRKESGIDLKEVLQDSEADSVLKDWATRMLSLGQRYRLRYE
jgi:hypothetical protein